MGDAATQATGFFSSTLPTWIVAVGGIAVAVIAIFQDRIRHWVHKGKFAVEASTLRPFSLPIPIRLHHGATGQLIAESNSYYFRIRVQNSGSASIKHPQAYLHQVLRRQSDGTLATVEEFLPCLLLWSDTPNGELDVFLSDSQRFVTLFFVVDPSTRNAIRPSDDKYYEGFESRYVVIEIDAKNKNFARTHLLPPGTYQLGLTLSGENADALQTSVEITVSGTWTGDLDQMREREVQIRIL